MMSHNKYLSKTSIYNDVFDNKSEIHSWKDLSEFQTKRNNYDDKLNNIEDIIGIEQSYRGVLNERNLFEELFTEVENNIISYFNKISTPSYLFKSEHKKRLRNKIRSYKGIINKNDLEEGSYIQIEIPIEGDYTLFASFIKLDVNKEKCLKYFMDSDTSFIISTYKKDIMTEKYLQLIVNELMYHKGNSQIKYGELIYKFCFEGDSICRMGGDGGYKEVDFQIFSLKENQESIIAHLAQAN